MRRAIIAALTGAALLAAAGGGAWWWHSRVTLPQASCGMVYGEPSAQTRLISGDSRAPGCFLLSARTCAAAGIRLHAQGVDSSTDYVWIISPGGKRGACQVTQYSQDSGPFGYGTVRTGHCQEAAVSGKGVTLACPGLAEAVLIPATVAGPAKPDPRLAIIDSTPNCGRASTGGIGTSTRLFRVSPGALTCFATAARGCTSGKLFIQQATSRLDAYFTFAIEPGGQPRCRVIEFIQDQGGGVPCNHFGTCQVASVTPGGVLLGCPGERILIPATG
jgi:hypothetical protein